MISDIFVHYGPWLWFVIAVLLFVLETVVPGVHFLWFGMAAFASGVIALLLPIDWQWQIVVFSLLSFVTVYIVRRSASADAAKSDEPVLNVRGAQYIGRRVKVEEAIRNGRGKVRVGDTVWPAQGEDALDGAEVQVTGVNGTVLVVERIGP
jgi:membrane protein implicated in regulation of membrane protease activity